MSNIVDLEKLFHRSKDRIKDLGEVFTPESYVEGMLDLLAKDKRGLWSDEETTFLNPAQGMAI
jgi:type I restriction-modification system DNA methylase subunit